MVTMLYRRQKFNIFAEAKNENKIGNGKCCDLLSKLALVE